jgi:hypothetical protein
MCADWEKGPVDLSIVERRARQGEPKNKGYLYGILCFFLYFVGLETNSKFFVQLAAGKIWEKGPVDLSIVEKRARQNRNLCGVAVQILF